MNNVHSDYVKNIDIPRIPRGTLGWHATGDFFVIFTGALGHLPSDLCWMGLISGLTFPADGPIRILPPGTTVSITVG